MAEQSLVQKLKNVFVKDRVPSISQPSIMPAIPTNPRMLQTTYTSDEVNIPDDFLVEPAWDAKEIEVKKIDFKNTDLPEYEGLFAVILENVLSPSECAQLVNLTEQSAKTQGWKPALLNMGGNYEVAATDYRNSDRIIWDSPVIVERLWKRCLQAEGLEESLATIDRDPAILSNVAAQRGEVWKFTRLNERMRYLRYGPGQFFQRHCDGSYVNPNAEGHERSLMTFHLYLTSNEGLKGGATAFHAKLFSASEQNDRELKVKPELGRVLIFQHRSLVHSGEDVDAGTKITMRTDLMYKLT